LEKIQQGPLGFGQALPLLGGNQVGSGAASTRNLLRTLALRLVHQLAETGLGFREPVAALRLGFDRHTAKVRQMTRLVSRSLPIRAPIQVQERIPITLGLARLVNSGPSRAR